MGAGVKRQGMMFALNDPRDEGLEFVLFKQFSFEPFQYLVCTKQCF